MLEYMVSKIFRWEQEAYLNEQAAEGWRLVAVNDEILYMERMVSVELEVQTDAELFSYPNGTKLVGIGRDEAA